MYKKWDGYKIIIHVNNGTSNRTECIGDNRLAPLNASLVTEGGVGSSLGSLVGLVVVDDDVDVDVDITVGVSMTLSTVLEILVVLISLTVMVGDGKLVSVANDKNKPLTREPYLLYLTITLLRILNILKSHLLN